MSSACLTSSTQSQLQNCITFKLCALCPNHQNRLPKSLRSGCLPKTSGPIITVKNTLLIQHVSTAIFSTICNEFICTKYCDLFLYFCLSTPNERNYESSFLKSQIVPEYIFHFVLKEDNASNLKGNFAGKWFIHLGRLKMFCFETPTAVRCILSVGILGHHTAPSTE